MYDKKIESEWFCRNTEKRFYIDSEVAQLSNFYYGFEKFRTVRIFNLTWKARSFPEIVDYQIETDEHFYVNSKNVIKLFQAELNKLEEKLQNLSDDLEEVNFFYQIQLLKIFIKEIEQDDLIVG